MESVELHIGALQIPKYLNTLESVLLHSEAPSLGQKVSLDNWFLGQLVQYQAATKQLVLVKIGYTDTNNTPPPQIAEIQAKQNRVSAFKNKVLS